MKPLKLSNYSNTPPGGWFYDVPETKQRVKAGGGIETLLTAVQKHYTDNDTMAPIDLPMLIEHATCLRTPTWCHYDDGSQPLLPSSSALSFSQAKQGAATLLKWIMSYGAKRVTQVEAITRATACMTCPFRASIVGCKSCHGNTIRDIVAKVTAGGVTPYDEELGACMVCGCTLQAKIWLPFGALEPYITESQWAHFAKAPKCWMITEKNGK